MKNKKSILIIILIIIVLILTILIIKLTNKKDYNKVPVLKITLNNINLDEINNNSKNIKYNDNKIEVSYDDKKILTEDIMIKGRGNTTWDYKKKPYQITFNNEVNLFNLGKTKKWVLLANYLDETLLRNHIAFYLGNKINLKYTNKGINVDLYVDNEYLGVYYLTPKVELSNASVNLKSNDALIMEIDNNYFFEEDNYYVSKYEKDHLTVKDIKDKNNSNKIIDRFMKQYNLFEKSVNENNWKNVAKYIDIESFCKYYIINSLTKNGDAYRSSFYLYQDGENDKIHAGPIWDFDLAFNNQFLNREYFEYNETVKNFNMTDIPIVDHYDSEIINKLLKFKEFKELVKNIWNKDFKNTKEDVLLEIDKNYNIIKDSASKNINKWNYTDTYIEYINEYKKTVEQLYKEFDTKINGK